MLKKWLIASRAPFSITLILPGILGIAVASGAGPLSWPDAILTIVGLFFANLGTNFTNDYFDYLSGVDSIDKGRVYKKGSEVLLSTGLPSWVVLASAIAGFLITAGVGAILAFRIDLLLLPLTLLGIAFGFFYTAPPFKFGYRGLGEFISGFGSGPLAVIGSYYVQTHRFSLEAAAVSIPVGLLVASILYIGNVSDSEADKQVGKKTLSVRLGRGAVVLLGPVFYLCIYLSILLSIVSGLISPWAAAGLFTIPLAWEVLKQTRMHYNDIAKYAPAIMKTVGVFATTILLIITGYVTDHFIATHHALFR